MKTAPPEEIERLNVEKELKEQMLSDWQKVDRIIAVRLLIITLKMNNLTNLKKLMYLSERE